MSVFTVGLPVAVIPSSWGDNIPMEKSEVMQVLPNGDFFVKGFTGKWRVSPMDPNAARRMGTHRGHGIWCEPWQARHRESMIHNTRINRVRHRDETAKQLRAEMKLLLRSVGAMDATPKLIDGLRALLTTEE